MNLILIFVCLAAAAGAATIHAPATAAQLQEKIRYDNYSVYKLNLHSRAQLSIVELVKQLTKKYDIWKEYDELTKETHIMVDPAAKTKFEALMKMFSISTELMIENVQSLIDAETATDGISSADPAADSFGWTRYYKLEQIEAWLDEILVTYSTVASGFTIGKSYEGRDIRGIKISHKSGNPGIFIESNIHAREWITSATATWFINQLLTSTDAAVRNLADSYDWYIIPVFNVDGFVYSHEKNRLWRKTRQPFPNTECIGTDGNRNFDSHWLESNGASANPCDETYAGPTPFSEPEAKALADYVTSIKDKISIYLSFHSYGQYLLSPYGHTNEEFPENYDDILKIGEAFSSAIGGLTYATQYTYGSTAAILYVASGTSVDWVFNTLDIKIGYTIEYRDKGRFGFVLPPVQILPNCEELMAGMLALVAKSKELGYI